MRKRSGPASVSDAEEGGRPPGGARLSLPRGALIVGVALFIASLPALTVIVPNTLIDDPVPRNLELPPPSGLEPTADGYLLVVIDAVGADWMADAGAMPLLHARTQDAARLDVTTGPYTLSALCVSEMMTGVPSSTGDGLRNFDLDHPGYDDAYLLAAQQDRDRDGVPDHSLGMLANYVMLNLYEDSGAWETEEFWYGHLDIDQADAEMTDRAVEWLEQGRHDTVAMHYGGTDHAGHAYGTTTPEWKAKLRSIDAQLDRVLDAVPEGWNVIVTGDHGMTVDGKHGGDEVEVRSTTAYVWGPRVVPGVSADATQRDLATLPIITFGTAFPVGLEGRIPATIFDLDASQLMAAEQWSWEAAVAHQAWRLEQDLPAVEGLREEEIDWDALDGEVAYMAPLDVAAYVVSLLVLVAGVWLAAGRPTRLDGPSTTVIAVTAAVAAGAVLTLFLARPLATTWNGTSFVAPVTVGLMIMGWFALDAEHRPARLQRLHERAPAWTPLAIGAATIWFGLARASASLAVVIVALVVWQWRSRQASRGERVLLAATLALSVAGLLSGTTRVFGVNVPGLIIDRLWPADAITTTLGLLLLLPVAWLAHGIDRPSTSPRTRLGFAAALGAVHVVNSLAQTWLDWVVIVSLSAAAALSLAATRDQQPAWLRSDLGPTLLAYAVFGGITLTLGPWPAAALLLLTALAQRVLQRLEPALAPTRPDPRDEAWRLGVLAIIPWAIWFAAMGLLGQTEVFDQSFMHPRELNPGRWFIRGGRVGARVDPSTTWIAVVAVLPFALWCIHLFTRWRALGLPLWPFTLAVGLHGVNALASLALAQDHPKIIINLTWGGLFALFLVATSASAWLIQDGGAWLRGRWHARRLPLATDAPSTPLRI